MILVPFLFQKVVLWNAGICPPSQSHRSKLGKIAYASIPKHPHPIERPKSAEFWIPTSREAY